MPLPKFDAVAVQNLIANNRITALSLDTQALREQNCNLSSPAMLALKQFSGTTVSLLLSEIVVGEIKAHIAEGAAEAKKKLAQALKEMPRKHYAQVDEIPILASFSEEPAQIAARLVDQMREEFAFRIHPAQGYVEVSEVLERYFQCIAPFESKADKKKEFPDAIALLSLENWAAELKITLLVVSKDVGWLRFAEESAHLICVADIPTALDLFNRSGRFIAERIIAAIQSEDTIDLSSGLNEALYQFVESLNPPDCDFWSHMDVELDFVVVHLENWRVNDNVGLRVLGVFEDDISFVFDVDLTLAVMGHFDFSVSDREGTMPMGSAQRKVHHHQSVPVAITVSKQALPNPEVSRIGVGTLKGRFVVRFGDLVPDDFYGPEEPDDADKGDQSIDRDDCDLQS